MCQQKLINNAGSHLYNYFYQCLDRGQEKTMPTIRINGRTVNTARSLKWPTSWNQLCYKATLQVICSNLLAYEEKFHKSRISFHMRQTPTLTLAIVSSRQKVIGASAVAITWIRPLSKYNPTNEKPNFFKNAIQCGDCHPLVFDVQRTLRVSFKCTSQHFLSCEISKHSKGLTMKLN